MKVKILVSNISSFLIKRKNRAGLIFFLLILTGLYFYFDYNHIIGRKPSSMHSWRSADCASFASRYYYDGMNFSEPKVNNVLNGEGNCTGEFPIIYYFVALLYKIFGIHEIIFRMVNLIFLLFGLISLFQLVKRITNDLFFAYIIPLLFFSSPIIAFFGNNFFCDVPAISCALIALNFIFKYKDTQNIKFFLLGCFFFSLAALLKLNSAISFMAILGMFFFELNSWVYLNNGKKLFVHPRINIIGFIITAMIIASWYLWAIHYNESYNVSFLGTKSWPGWPLWEADDRHFVSTLTYYSHYLPHFFHLIVCAVLAFLTVFIIRNINHLPALLQGLFILSFAGCLVFFAVFFVGIGENIYYVVNLMIVPILIFICAAVVTKKKYSNVFFSPVFRVVVLILLLLNVYQAKSKLSEEYYHGGISDSFENKNLHENHFRVFLDSLGLGKHDKIISIPDITPNVTLYLADRQGWSNFNFNNDSLSFENCIKRGAKYLIITDITLLNDSVVRMFANNYLGKYKNIFVYRLLQEKRTLMHNDKVSLLAANGKYVSLKPSGEMRADIDSTGDAERFTLIDIGGNLFYIIGNDKKYISSDLLADGLLHIPRNWVADWEMFQKVQIDSTHIAMKAYNGKYVSTDLTADRKVIANREQIGENETFLIVK